MATCALCDVRPHSGHNVSHSNRHTKRRFKANVHKQALFQGGKSVRVMICTRCMRSMAKSSKIRRAIGSLA